MSNKNNDRQDGKEFDQNDDFEKFWSVQGGYNNDSQPSDKLISLQLQSSEQQLLFDLIKKQSQKHFPALDSFQQPSNIEQNFNHMSLTQNQQLRGNQQPDDKPRSRTEKGKLYAKSYRQKKKEEVKFLQDQNTLLKRKVQDLSFRLKEVQIELNKLKYNKQHQSHNIHHTSKQDYLKQVEIHLRKEQLNLQTLLQIEKGIKNLSNFSCKHKMDMLNYLMSELLQNLVNDLTLYFMDSVIDKKGLFRQSQLTPYSRIDQEILQFYDMSAVNEFKKNINSMSGSMHTYTKNFKELWKKLYKDYLNIIKEGTMMESLCEPVFQKLKKQDGRRQVLNYLKLELYFEKIKYRKDMRLLRSSWFKEFQEDEEKSRYGTVNKKVKG